MGARVSPEARLPPSGANPLGRTSCRGPKPAESHSAAAEATSTDTPGPIVELSEIFFR